MFTHSLKFFLLCFVTLSLSACSNSEEIIEEDLPPVEVDLPEVPALELLDTAHTYEDGSYSIIGLRLNKEELFERMLSVSAIVDEIYTCESVTEQLAARLLQPLDEEGEPVEINRAGCLFPHIYVVDNLRSEQRFLIVGYDWEHFEPQLTIGQRYSFHGTYTQRARGHMSSEYGLLVTNDITGEGIVPVPPPVLEDE